MKPLVFFLLALILLLPACGSSYEGGNFPYPPPQQSGQETTQPYPASQDVSPTGAEGYPAPAGTPSSISWEEAKATILQGKVSEVIQLHSLTVYLVLADGTRLMAEEPEIDAVLTVIEECGSLCEEIEVIAE